MTAAEHPQPNGENPYLATTLEAASDPVAFEGAEGIRRAYLKHEANVKSVGTLYILGSLLLGLASIGSFFALFSSNSGSWLALGFGAVYLAIATVQGITGYGLWRLMPWARWIAVAFCVLGLLALPIGTLISAFILYLLLCQKGAMVFSEPYRHVIAQTPHVRYRTSIVTWIVLVVFLAFLSLAVLWVVFAA